LIETRRRRSPSKVLSFLSDIQSRVIQSSSWEKQHPEAKEMEIVEERHGQCLRSAEELGDDEVNRSQDTNIESIGNSDSSFLSAVLDTWPLRRRLFQFDWNIE
jgi:hypothetical protein